VPVDGLRRAVIELVEPFQQEWPGAVADFRLCSPMKWYPDGGLPLRPLRLRDLPQQENGCRHHRASSMPRSAPTRRLPSAWPLPRRSAWWWGLGWLAPQPGGGAAHCVDAWTLILHGLPARIGAQDQVVEPAC